MFFGKRECALCIAFFVLFWIMADSQVFVIIMSTQSEDRTTIDMFSRPERGRPKTSPYERSTQLKLSKRLQRNRDKRKGMCRIEVKLNADIVEVLDTLAADLGLSRAEVIENGLMRLLGEMDKTS
ncbi:MAG: LexA regulated protein [Oleispira sp.]|nr:LexA regulated protein [Oleispira sp.]MBL4881408.1 LexA regulated protein [Oleispira sp.]